MKKAILVMLLASPFLFGCVVGGVRSDISDALPFCEDTPDHLDCVLNTNSGVVKELKPTEDAVPTLGLALSGGGSKAAPFAMGVVKRFVDEGWLFKTDYLSSVSGGSYTAFYLYYKAYRTILDDKPPIKAYPGLTRYFLDTRRQNDLTKKEPFVEFLSPDEVRHGWYSLAELPARLTPNNRTACYELPPYPVDDPNQADLSAPVWKYVQQASYQGWVECYQDLLRTGHAHMSKFVDGAGNRLAYAHQLGNTFSVMFAESLITAPVNWFANVAFDWKWRVSPTQYDYLYGILRTYAYMPEEGDVLPVSPYDDYFYQMTKCLDFSDLSIIYTRDPVSTEEKLGGYMPKWILQATANTGNVGLDLSPRHYDLGTDVFEISFDFFGSGRFGYVQGSPFLVGLTVPMAVLSSAAFADTAQRSIHVPRGVVNFGLQTINLRWGFDIPNYREPDSSRRLHSVLIWPFYYLDSPVTTEKGPTIHLSDGGQTGDNLGLVSLMRRGVKNIVAVAGENDYDTKSGALVLASLCSANYYLNVRGYTMDFDGDPMEPDSGAHQNYHLAERCTWDKNRSIYVHPDNPGSFKKLTPFAWKRRVWVGHVVPYTPGVGGQPPLLPKEQMADPSTVPKHLKDITVYYINSAMDQEEWQQVVDEWYPVESAGSEEPLKYQAVGQLGSPKVCKGVYPDKNARVQYSCPLIEYFHDTRTATEDGGHKWVFPQTSTAFTTYSNSVNLFRAYRDLGWLYAGYLPNASDDLRKVLLGDAKNPQPAGLSQLYNEQKPRYPKDTYACRGWNGGRSVQVAEPIPVAP
ncbi:hypothetical protein AWB78_02387 [Caballeronia calidae]|uniref:Patatin-like phospholipase n=1 Tax=Caballeronia calidae TaxID=1777139 RepID=A0A158B9Y9_9BURK|nr:hypothetical protein [Caballeronia calidae]SAK66167.1 hypothetical protein AWB78_02387 [Caballeronia calidae]